MNQLIIILLFLKNFFRPFRITATRIAFSISALLLSFYVYHVYNNVQQQTIWINSKTKGNAKTDLEYLTLNLNYAEANINKNDTVHSALFDIKFLRLLNPIRDSVSYNGDSISKLVAIKKFDNDIKSKIYNTDFISNLYVGFAFYDNSWFVSHPTDPIRKIPQYQKVDDCEIDSSLCKLSYSNVEVDTHRPNWLGFYMGRKRHILRMQSLFSYDSKLLTDSLNSFVKLSEHISNNIAIYEPHWYSAYDVSKFQLDIIFDVDTLNQFLINFGDLTNIAELLPAPDKKTLYGILYNDPNKLDFIIKQGLHLYLEFPKQESLQQTRNYVLSALITLFLTLVATLSFNFAKNVYRRRNRLKKLIKSLEKHHSKYYSILKSDIKTIDGITVGLIALCVGIFNPYDWTALGKFCIIGIVVGCILSMDYKYNTAIEDYPFTKKINKRNKLVGCVLILVSFIIFFTNEVFNKTIDTVSLFALITGSLIGIIPLIIFVIIMNRKRKQ